MLKFMGQTYYLYYEDRKGRVFDEVTKKKVNQSDLEKAYFPFDYGF